MVVLFHQQVQITLRFLVLDFQRSVVLLEIPEFANLVHKQFDLLLEKVSVVIEYLQILLIDLESLLQVFDDEFVAEGRLPPLILLYFAKFLHNRLFLTRLFFVAASFVFALIALMLVEFQRLFFNEGFVVLDGADSIGRRFEVLISDPIEQISGIPKSVF